jgi:hypothetical protein
MNPKLLLDLIIRPALSNLAPDRWDSRPAQHLLGAIAKQESGLRHRDQMSRDGTPGPIGPATGLWQFELAGGFRGVEKHPATASVLLRARKLLLLPDNEWQRWAALCWSDHYACLCARALLWTIPDALPGPEEPDFGWGLYLEAWRPGSPHPETWHAAWDAAADAVYGGVSA